jgi:C1A family cysteine protease
MPKRRYHGWHRQLPDWRDFRYHPATRPAELPAKVDLRTPDVMRHPFEPNLDQGDLGSCGPNSAAENLVFDMLLHGGGDAVPVPSRLFIYYITRELMGTVDEDSGVDNRTMLKALAGKGWCDESRFPYVIDQFTQAPSAQAYDEAKRRTVREYQAVAQDLDTMRGCLADGRAFIFGFAVYQSFESAAVEKTGDVPMPGRREKLLGGHDVLVVGYDDAAQRFIFRNSWGEAWGAGGDGTIPYAYATNPDLADDFWTIVGAGYAPSPAPDPGPPPRPDPGPEVEILTLKVPLEVDWSHRVITIQTADLGFPVTRFARTRQASFRP